MPNMRLITGNAIERASLSASSTAGSLSIANVRSNSREAVWRATAKTATITMTWSALENIGGVALGWTNLTDSAQVQVKLYLNTGDASPMSTTTANPASDFPLGFFAWGPDSASSGVLKVSSQVQVWPRANACRKVEIVITDTANTANIEVGRVMVGPSYEMNLGPSYGASLTLVDRSRVSRTESSALRREPDKILRRLNVTFPMMVGADSRALLQLAGYGKGAAAFVSLAPDTASEINQTHAFFAATVEDHAQSIPFLNRYETSLTLEEVG